MKVPAELRGSWLGAIENPRGDTRPSHRQYVERRLARMRAAKHSRLQHLITRLSTGMISLTPHRIDAGINGALEDVGLFARVDRCYVFQLDDDQSHVTNSHEWCAIGIEPEIDCLQSLPASHFPWVMARLLRGEVVHVPRVADLPVEAAGERQEWEREGIASLLLVPVQAVGKVVGYVGFDSVRREKHWPLDIIDLLRIFGEMVFNALARKEADMALRRHSEALAAANAELARANAALENANRAKDTFLANMSHELRTPLNSIIGFTGTLLMKLGGPLTPDQESQLSTVESSAQHLLSLINDLLDLAKIAAGKLVVTRSAVECSEILREVHATLQPLASAKNLELSIACPSASVVINTDRRALKQILINLANNAIKFTDKGRVTISLEIPAHPSGDIVFAVADTGVGITSDDQRRLFKAFSQCTDREGTGLGLHLSQKLAGLLGGTIRCFSVPGRGSRFWLSMGTT